MFAASLSLYASTNSVLKFNGLNYAEWSEHIRFALGVMALDSTILTDEEPPTITLDSSGNEKSRYETCVKNEDIAFLYKLVKMVAFSIEWPAISMYLEEIQCDKEKHSNFFLYLVFRYANIKADNLAQKVCTKKGSFELNQLKLLKTKIIIDKKYVVAIIINYK